MNPRFTSPIPAVESSAALLSSALETDAQGGLVAEPGPVSQWIDPKEGEQFWRVIGPSGETVAQSGVAEMGIPPLDPVTVKAALAGREVIHTISVTGDEIRVFTGPVVREGQIIGVDLADDPY